MSKLEIAYLKDLLKTRTVVWNPDPDTCRVVKHVGKHAEEGDDEPCAIFHNGEYVALYNCTREDFKTIAPII